MKQIRLLPLSLCLFSLSACQTWDGVMEDISSLEIPSISSPSASDPRSDEFVISGNCPRVEIVDELSIMNEYIDISDQQPYNLISNVNLTQAESNCNYSGKSATVDLKLAFEGSLGPRARVKDNDRPFFSYPFFVAVTAPNGTILAKEVFSASMTYDTGQDHQTYYESMRQIIPITDPARGNRYKVLVGFQLSQDQLNQNRAALRQQKKAATETAAQEVVIQQQPQQQPVNTLAPAAGSPKKNTGPIDITTPIEEQ